MMHCALSVWTFLKNFLLLYYMIILVATDTINLFNQFSFFFTTDTKSQYPGKDNALSDILAHLHVMYGSLLTQIQGPS